MLNSESEYVLRYVLNIAKDDYVIINFNDVLLDSPIQFALDKIKLNDIIMLLKNNGYIRIKYNDLNSICVLVEQKGKDYVERLVESEVKIENKTESLFGICFFGAFVGSFLGALIISLLIFIVGG